jgi:hypothetical protein
VEEKNVLHMTGIHAGRPIHGLVTILTAIPPPIYIFFNHTEVANLLLLKVAYFLL